MLFEIKSRRDGTVRFSLETTSLKLCVEAAVKARAYLGGADLGGAYLGDANLSVADLGGANLRGTNLRGANLRGANLGGAYLRGAYLDGANLSDAYLGGAYLCGAYLRGANLSGAYLCGAKIISLLARVTRNDGYEFIAFETDKGVIIRAGCRQMSPAGYRAHVAKEYPNTDKATETLDILDYIDRKAWRAAQKRKAEAA